jgi:hypothetical protein
VKTYRAKFSNKTVTRKNNKEPKVAVGISFENSFGVKIFKSSWGKDERSACKNLLNLFVKGSFIGIDDELVVPMNDGTLKVFPIEIVLVEEVV